jgi:hypothetical protein
MRSEDATNATPALLVPAFEHEFQAAPHVVATTLEHGIRRLLAFNAADFRTSPE